MEHFLPTLMAVAVDTRPLPQADATNVELRTILAIIFGIVGALAFLMITISGLRYVLSNGDPQKTAQAKDGIVYSLIGLVVAITAEAIVALVLGRID